MWRRIVTTARARSASWLLRLLPMLFGLVCLALFAARLDWPAVGAALVQASAPPLALGAAFSLLSLLPRALRWRLLLGDAAPPLSVLLSRYAAGVGTGLVVPASGELTRALLLGRGAGLGTSYVLGSVAAEKALDTATVAGGLVMAVGLASASPWLGGARLGLAAAAVAPALALGALLSAHHARVAASAGRSRWRPSRFGRAEHALAARGRRFLDGLRATRQLALGARLLVGALTVLIWANACAAIMCVLVAFGLPADWRLAAALYAALLLGLSVPSAPGALGTFELVCTAVLALWGETDMRAAAFALGLRLATQAPLLAAGALAMAALGVAARPAASRLAARFREVRPWR